MPVITATKKRATKKASKKLKAAKPSKNNVKPKLYASLVVQLLSLLKGEHDFIANAANFSALLFSSLPNVNWAGFYLLKDGELVRFKVAQHDKGLQAEHVSVVRES